MDPLPAGTGALPLSESDPLQVSGQLRMGDFYRESNTFLVEIAFAYSLLVSVRFITHSYRATMKMVSRVEVRPSAYV